MSKMKARTDRVLESAREALRIESDAILAMMDRLDEKFEKAVEAIYTCKGRVVVTGMGKSGIIARKIASTFASTATPAFFVHPAEGIHGDLGMIVKSDVVLALSNSGETEELTVILPLIKRQGNVLIAMTGDANSNLARRSDIVLDVGVKEEACPLGLAPTASTTAALAMGDALAVALLKRRGLKAEDFALFHPGGSLGKKLLFKVEDLMHVGEDIPRVQITDIMKDAIYEITAKKFGMTTVVDDRGKFLGIITDGDLRRFFEREMGSGKNSLTVKAGDVMTKNPKTIDADALAAKAVQMMEQYSITTLVILGTGGDPMGVIHLHDLLKAGVV